MASQGPVAPVLRDAMEDDPTHAVGIKASTAHYNAIIVVLVVIGAVLGENGSSRATTSISIIPITLILTLARVAVSA